ncbi:PDZ domain-containing protein [Thermaurantiacus sp.]
MGLPDRGVVVTAIEEGAVARRLSIPRPGDVIEAVNGRPVREVGEVVALLQASPGRTQFRINRAGQRQECLFEAPRRFACVAG